MISRERLADLLNAELTRKACSFAEYITMSAPYVPPGAEDLLRLVERMARADREHAGALEDAIVALSGIPEPGIYDEGVADTNYLNIIYLSELLVCSHRSCVEQTRKRIEDCAGHPSVRELLLKIAEADAALLSELEAAVERHNPKPVEKKRESDEASDAAASCGAGTGPSKSAFDLKSFLARRGPGMTRPPGTPSPLAAPPPAKADAQAPSEQTPETSVEKKPFDMKAYLAARKAQKGPEARPHDGSG